MDDVAEHRALIDGSIDAELIARRGCYCRPGELHCGTCRVCGKPGHACHYPGPAPFTGAWCDDCYVAECRSWGMFRESLRRPSGVVNS